MALRALLRAERGTAQRRRMLARERTISEIADHLGFSSGPNFSTLFKDRFQITPRQYRTSSGSEI